MVALVQDDERSGVTLGRSFGSCQYLEAAYPLEDSCFTAVQSAPLPGLAGPHRAGDAKSVLGLSLGVRRDLLEGHPVGNARPAIVVVPHQL